MLPPKRVSNWLPLTFNATFRQQTTTSLIPHGRFYLMTRLNLHNHNEAPKAGVIVAAKRKHYCTFWLCCFIISCGEMPLAAFGLMLLQRFESSRRRDVYVQPVTLPYVCRMNETVQGWMRRTHSTISINLSFNAVYNHMHVFRCIYIYKHYEYSGVVSNASLVKMHKDVWCFL